MRRQDWVDLAWWMCFAGALLVTVVLVHVVTVSLIGWLLLP